MEPLIKQNGPVKGTVQVPGEGRRQMVWRSRHIGSQIKGPCSRIDLMKKFAGIDVQEMYPAGSPPKADNWTTDTFLKAAEACHKGGVPFGIGLGTTTNSVDTSRITSSPSARNSSTQKATSRSRPTTSVRRLSSTRN